MNYGTFVRLLLTGALDSGFGNGGVLDISNFGTPTRVAFTSTGNIVTGLTIQDPADGVQKSYVVELTGTLAGPWVAQTITFDALPDRTYGDFFQVSATASSGLAVSYRGERRLHGRGQFRAAHRRRQLHDHREPGRQCHLLCGDAGGADVRRHEREPGDHLRAGPAGVTVGQPLVMVSATSGSSTRAVDDSDRVLVADTCRLHHGRRQRRQSDVRRARSVHDRRRTRQVMATTVAATAGDAELHGGRRRARLRHTYHGHQPHRQRSGQLARRDRAGQRAPRSRHRRSLRAVGHHRPDFGADPDIRTRCSIVGPGADILTIDGNANNRIFSISATDPGMPGAGWAGLSRVDLRPPPHEWRVELRRQLRRGHLHRSTASRSIRSSSTTASPEAAAALPSGCSIPGRSLTIANSQFLDNTARDAVTSVHSSNASGGGLTISGQMPGPGNTVGDLPTRRRSPSPSPTASSAATLRSRRLN